MSTQLCEKYTSSTIVSSLNIYSIGFILITFIFLNIFSIDSAKAATTNQIKAIQISAEEYINALIELPPYTQVEISASKLDSRIKATDCPTSLVNTHTAKNLNTSRVTVQVSCPADDWSIYVPVKIERLGERVVAASPLKRGQLITQGDVMIMTVSLHHSRQSGVVAIEDVIGTRLKRNVRAGNLVQRQDICIVCKNDSVIIRATKSNLSLTSKGVALSDGQMGESIRVKNSRSQRIIHANVIGIGEVSVRF
ncbi:flagellar basal body P-ring formation chaperone FlgA [Vibrio sp.]|nr:flagellar basal body P-ring formation chaperone FlgA [Vibrio sp.]